MPNRAPIVNRELSARGFSGHELRRVRKLNETLKQTRELADRFGDSHSSIAVLAAETRVLVLQVGRYEFGQQAKMHFHAVKNLETPGSTPQHESLSRTYRVWERLSTERGMPTSAKQKLRAACTRLLDLLIPVHDETGRAYRDTVDGLYKRWLYQCGREAFESASRKTNSQRVALSYGALWQRREAQMIPDFEEVRILSKSLDRDLCEATEVWARQKDLQLRERGTAPPVASLIIRAQQRFAGLRMTAASLHEHLGWGEKTAQAINRGQLVPFEDIRSVAQKIFSRADFKKLHSDWSAAIRKQSAGEDFATAFPRICAENNWNNHMLATLLEVRPPEERQPSKRKRNNSRRRVEVYRPSAEVRRMYQQNAFSAQAPAKAAIDLVADRNRFEGDQGENQLEYLTRLFLEGVELRLHQRGNGAHDSPIRQHRTLCGVTPEDLAEVCSLSRQEILLVERGRQTVTDAEQRRLLKLIEAFPARKVTRARGRIDELRSPPQTVVESVTRLRERHGGYIPLSRRLHDETDRRLNLSPVHLKRIEQQLEVPPLPILRHLVERGGSQVTPDLLDDWYAQMPEHLESNSKLRWRHPLVRGFGIIVFERWQSLREFWETEFKEDFSYSIVTRNFQQMNGHGCDFPWSTISRYLNAAGLGLRDPRRLYLQLLYEAKDDIARSLARNRVSEAQAGLNKVLLRWRRELGSAKLARKHENRLGLNQRERAKLK